MQSAVRSVRLIQFAMLASVGAYVVAGELVGRNQPPNSALFHVLSLVSIMMVGATVVVRRTLVLPSENLLRQKPSDARTLERWKAGYLFLYVMCDALALLGLVLRLLGLSLAHIWGFYLGGFVLLLLFSPRPPSPDLRSQFGPQFR